MKGSSLVRVLFIAAVPCLLVQMVVRAKISEPYPAIFFPDGSDLMRPEFFLTQKATRCVAVDSLGREYPVAIDSLLACVPSFYRRYVVSKGFGLTVERDTRKIRIPLPGNEIRIRLARPLTPGQREETRAWLRSRIRELAGVTPHGFRIRYLEAPRNEAQTAEPEWRMRKQVEIPLAENLP